MTRKTIEREEIIGLKVSESKVDSERASSGLAHADSQITAALRQLLNFANVDRHQALAAHDFDYLVVRFSGSSE